ncbi:hypothetical protein LCGC14_0249120 [marine sediment metagenome]|uniref:Uncharacterized protein n=1 Tax=marine sediment metagenome TaxID=412755 RepID=A0A0F9U9Q2_9ZZZZ
MIDFERAQVIVDYLNGLLELDRPAVAALIANRVPCNKALADHPTCQVVAQHGSCHVGLLGILNGLCGKDKRGWGGIVVVFSSPGDSPKTNAPRETGHRDLARFEVAGH